MTEEVFIAKIKMAIVELFPNTKEEDWYTVWLTEVLQNNKALLSTDEIDDKYIEVTYNGDSSEMYVDVYEHKSNTVVKF